MKKKYETFYTCPGCGQLVPKGTTVCDCGYVFEDTQKVSVFLVILFSILIDISLEFLYGLAYGLFNLLANFLHTVYLFRSIASLPLIGSWIKGIFGFAIIGMLFTSVTLLIFFLFSKINGKREIQYNKSIIGGTGLVFLNSAISIISYLRTGSGSIGFYILLAITSGILFFIHLSSLRSFPTKKAVSAIPQDDYKEKKRYAQMRVDAFYAEIFAGQTNPYTGLPVKSEKDYLEYLRAKKKAEVSSNGESANSQSSMGRSFSELVRDEKLEQAKINAMTKEAYAQYRVDKVCAELFKGQKNPYTQKPITCEADFREYQRQHNS